MKNRTMQIVRTNRSFKLSRTVCGALVAAATLAVAQGASAATQYWDLNGGTAGLGGAAGGTWDLSANNWSLDSTGASATSPWINANDAVFDGTAGTVNVDGTAGVTVGNMTFNVTGYTVTGGQLTLTGAPTIKGSASTTTTLSAPLAGSATGLTFLGAGGGSTTFTLGSNNSYTGDTVISQSAVNFSSLANDGTNSSFGSSGTVQLGNNGSYLNVTYTGAAASTDRLWVAGGTGAANLNANGSGAISFTNTGSAAGGTTPGNRSLSLQGSSGSTVINTFGEQVSDMPTFATTLQKSGTNVWELTAASGMNTYSGGTNVAGGTLLITGSDQLGTGSVNFTGNATLSAAIPTVTGGNTFTLNNPITVAGGKTGTLATTSANADGSVFDIAGLVTGTGTLKASNGSYARDPILLSNDSNSFSNFQSGPGTAEFTSVADGGINSSLGAGTTAYTVNNGNSASNLGYVGTTDTSTNRAIAWGAVTGKLTLENNGTGTVQFLSTTPIRTGTGAANLTLGGTNTGANTLGQVVNDSTSGATSVTEQGPGNWVLSAANTYTGATTITGGSLTVNGSIAAASAVSVTGGALAGTGTVAGPVTTSGGAILPGDTNSAGTLTASGGTTLGDNSGLQYFLNTPDVTGGTGGNSLLATTDLGLGTGISLTVAPGGAFGLGTYNLIDYSGTLTDNSSGFTGYTVTGLPSGEAGTFHLGTDGAINSLQLSVAAVPEPTSLALLGLGGLAMIRRRRRSA